MLIVEGKQLIKPCRQVVVYPVDKTSSIYPIALVSNISLGEVRCESDRLAKINIVEGKQLK